MRLISVIILMICLTHAGAQDVEKGTYLSLFKKQSRKKISAGFLPEAIHYDTRNGDKVLDIGGNDGALIIPLSLVTDTLDYYLEDIHTEYFPLADRTLAFVKEKINHKADFSIHTILGTDSLIPLSGIQFDRIMVRETFHHFTNPDLMLGEIKRLLSPSGKLMIIEPADQKKFKYCKLLSSDVIIKMVTTAGFRYIGTTNTPPMVIYTFSK